MLAAVLSVLGLVAFGLAARWVISMTADTSGQIDVSTLTVWRFHGWEVIVIFGLFVLADVIVLAAMARDVLTRLRTSVASNTGSA